MKTIKSHQKIDFFFLLKVSKHISQTNAEAVDFSPLLLWSIIWEEGKKKKKKKIYKFYIYYPAT